MAPFPIPQITHHARSFVASTLNALPLPADLTARTSSPPSSNHGSPLGPLAARALLLARDDTPEHPTDPGQGVLHYEDINNNAVFALFGLLGAAFVVVGIWFFFWAKNGGFYFKKDDWDEYKSTVLRRKGPNGTVLSGATATTDLGGGSIYKDVDDGTTTVTESTAMSGITAGVSDIAGRERRRKKRESRRREKEREKEKKNHSSRRHVGEDGVLIDEEAEQEAKDHLRSYRHERPARVGGLNKESDGSAWDGSTNPPTTESNISGSDLGLLANRERTPTTTPTATPTKSAGGIRKVYSTADRNAEREHERIKAEARKLQERGRAAAAASGHGRRDFSYQRAESNLSESTWTGVHRQIEDGSSATASEVVSKSQMPGSWAAESDIGLQSTASGSHGTSSRPGTSGDRGTKSYQCHIPGLSSSSGTGSGSGAASSSASSGQKNEYAEERRKKRAGRSGGGGEGEGENRRSYRRGRGRGEDTYTDVSLQ